MRFFSPLLILVALLAAACGGTVLPDEFTRERADGKIPVSIPLIREQTQKEIDGMPEGQAKAERWQQIEKDHNQCRLLSVRSSRAEANEVFAACMSKRDYLYMFRLDAEHLHNDIAAAESVNYVAEKKAAKDVRLAAEKKAEEERQRKEHAAAVERQREKERRAAERRQEEEAHREAAHRREQERLAAEHRRKQQEKHRLTERKEKAKRLIPQLFDAVKNSNASKVRYLLAAGVNSNTITDSGFTPLMIASFKGYSEIAKMLLAAGANPNMANEKGWVPLMDAAYTNRPKITKILLAAGANPNATTNEGWTALMGAAKRSPKMTKMLLAAGADPNAVTQEGWTALMWVDYDGYSDIAKMLLAAGANPDMINNNGQTALMRVAQAGYPEIVKILLAAGANPDVINNIGQTALSIAEEKGYREIAKMIRAAMLNLQATDSPKTESPAAQVFENVWRNIVVIRQGDKQGSGVIIRPNMVATNCHVIDSDGNIVIYKHDNRRATTDTTYNAVVRKRDIARDFCLLTVAGLQGSPAKLRRYNTLDIGEDVYAVGSPRGLDLSLSSGIISQLRQGTNTRYIQTDASVSPGSSGGGLFDSAGNLIGILTAKIADENVEGIGFAIPADLAAGL